MEPGVLIEQEPAAGQAMRRQLLAIKPCAGHSCQYKSGARGDLLPLPLLLANTDIVRLQVEGSLRWPLDEHGHRLKLNNGYYGLVVEAEYDDFDSILASVRSLLTRLGWRDDDGMSVLLLRELRRRRYARGTGGQRRP